VRFDPTGALELGLLLPLHPEIAKAAPTARKTLRIEDRIHPELRNPCNLPDCRAVVNVVKEVKRMVRLVSGIVDVFAEEALSGNPLAVVEGADALPDATLRRIAREFNQAETTFILRSSRADKKLRSFTANGSEVFGAGHNALGAWLWLAERGELGALDAPQTFQQEIGDAVLPISLERRGNRVHGRMKQSPLKLSEPFLTIQPLAGALQVNAEDIVLTPPPRVADTGANHLQVRVRNQETVDRAKPSADALLSVLRTAGAEGCYIYAFDPDAPSVAYARFFNPTVGLWEDSATGTAAGPLCAYLGASGMLAADNALTIEQGTLMGRKSLLHVRLTPDAELSGAGVVVMQGELIL
jgi:PhzF family phenazine biosynthesis protein